MTALIRAVLATWRCLACDTWNGDNRALCSCLTRSTPQPRPESPGGA